LLRNDKNTCLTINQNIFYYLTLHIKLSTFFYSTQLIDIFAYDALTNLNIKNAQNFFNIKVPNLNNNILVYNFHSIFYQQRFYIFVLNKSFNNINKNSIN